MNSSTFRKQWLKFKIPLKKPKFFYDKDYLED